MTDWRRNAKWEPDQYEGWKLDLWIVELHVGFDPVGWSAHFGGHRIETGHSETVEAAKAEALDYAKRLIAKADRQVRAALKEPKP
jgi:hypothetical protein